MTDRQDDRGPEALQTLWQGQETESPTMTLHAIRALVRNDRDHMRNQLMFGLVLVATEAVAFTPLVVKAKNDVIRAGGATILVGLAWMAWRLWRRRVGQGPDAAASAQALIAFQRQSLERRRANYGWLLVSAGPAIAGLLITTYGFQLARPLPAWWMATFFGFLGLWFLAAWLLQRRQAGQLQAQIEDLDRMSGGG